MAMYVGTAGWSIPKGFAEAFPLDGGHLERYARVLKGAEINSTFYRPHMPKTYARWAASTPEGFRFALKAPRVITHERRLRDALEPLEAFLNESSALGEKRGPLLFQLPPSLAFDAAVAEAFLEGLRERHDGPVAWEPRHPSWFTPEVERLLTAYGIARVAADPARVPAAAQPGGDPQLVYYRWHGSPVMYRSEYAAEAVAALASAMAKARGAQVWAIFDNTASGAATGNALALGELLAGGRRRQA